MLASETSGATPDYRVDAIIPLRTGDRSIAKIRVGPVAMTVFVVGGRVSWPRSAAGHAIAAVPDKSLREKIEKGIIANLPQKKEGEIPY